jgi:5-methylcytosine-specific restriction endonuclease McrBC GTP-binding regulatory subunit McrB
VKYSKRTPPLLFSKEPDATWTVDRQAVENEFPELLDVPKNLKAFTPVESDIRRYRFVTFHQSFCYEDFVEGIKPVVRTDAEGEDVGKGQGEIKYTIKPGVFRELADEARKDPSNKYALFIDEINRGNVANIFGELITFIEEDKRLDADGDLERSPWTATLPYSRQRFGVPRNLHIIGTMNTADRSIEALDTALRRRFSFVPTYPNPELLRGYQPDGFGVNLESLLKAINERLEVVLDRDHTIGHSYFMSLKAVPDPLAELQRVFANSILPLLQEYFYGNPSRIGMILGSTFVRKSGAPAKLAKGDWDTSDAEEKEVYEIAPQDKWNLAAFQSIYA